MHFANLAKLLIDIATEKEQASRKRQGYSAPIALGTITSVSRASVSL